MVHSEETIVRATNEDEEALERAEAMILLSTNEHIREQATQTDSTQTDSSVQTDRSLGVKEQGTDSLPSRVFGVTMIQGSNSATKFYTGLPTWSIFLYVFMFLSPFISAGRCLAFDDEFSWCW